MTFGTFSLTINMEAVKTTLDGSCSRILTLQAGVTVGIHRQAFLTSNMPWTTAGTLGKAVSWNVADLIIILKISSIALPFENFFIRPSLYGTYYGMVMSVQVSVRPSDSPSVRVSVRPFFSYMLWNIELKFCTWLCFYVLQIKFECRHYALVFERVMLLCELRI